MWVQIRSHIAVLTVGQININHQMYLCHVTHNCNIFQICYMVDKIHLGCG